MLKPLTGVSDYWTWEGWILCPNIKDRRELLQKLTEKAAEVRNLKYRFCAILCEQWKSTYLFNGLNCLHCLYKNVSILLCLSKLLMFVCMYISILLLLFYFLVTLLNNVLEYSMCQLMFLNRIIFDFFAIFKRVTTIFCPSSNGVWSRQSLQWRPGSMVFWLASAFHFHFSSTPTYEPNAVCWSISPTDCHFS